MAKKRKRLSAPAEMPSDEQEDSSPGDEQEDSAVAVSGSSSEEGVIVVGTYEGALLGFRIDGVQTFGYAPHVGCVKAVTCSRAGRLASGGTDHSVRLFDLVKARELGELQEHEDTVACLDFAGTTTLVTAGDDGQVCIWRLSDWELLLKFRAHKCGVATVAAHPSGRLMASAGRDRSLRLWDLTRGTSAANLSVDAVVEVLAWAPDGHHLAALSARQLIVVDARTAVMGSYQEPVNANSVGTMTFTACAFLRDDVIIVGDDKGTLRVLRAVGNTVAEVFRLPADADRRGRVKAIVTCGEDPQGVIFAIGMSLGRVEVWRIEHGVLPTAGGERILSRLHVVDTGARLTCLTAWSPRLAAMTDLAAGKNVQTVTEARADNGKSKKRKKKRRAEQ